MSQARETPDTLLALLRLRQWRYDRGRLNRGSASNYQRTGWRERRTRDADAALVRCIDFERAFSTLPTLDAAILLLIHRDGQRIDAAARISGVSEGTVASHRRKALQALAVALDKRNLL